MVNSLKRFYGTSQSSCFLFSLASIDLNLLSISTNQHQHFLFFSFLHIFWLSRTNFCCAGTGRLKRQKMSSCLPFEDFATHATSACYITLLIVQPARKQQHSNPSIAWNAFQTQKKGQQSAHCICHSSNNVVRWLQQFFMRTTTKESHRQFSIYVDYVQRPSIH